MGLGFVPVILTTTGLIVGTAPPERAGSASAISETSAEFGGALGVAVLGSLGTLFYRFGMQDADLDGLSPIDRDAVTAALGTALEVARNTGNEAAPWIGMARDSFAGGFALCCALATVTLLLLAAIAARVYARTELDESRISGH